MLIRLLIAGRTVNGSEKDGVLSLSTNMTTIGDLANKIAAKNRDPQHKRYIPRFLSS